MEQIRRRPQAAQKPQASGGSAQAESAQSVAVPPGVTVHPDGSRSLERAPGVRLYADGRAWVESIGRFWPREKGRSICLPGWALGPHLARAPLSRLLLEAFVGPPPSPHHVARHLNDVPAEEAVSNLAWGTCADNRRDSSVNFLRRRWGAACERYVHLCRLRWACGERPIGYRRWFGVTRARIRKLAEDPAMFPGVLTDPRKLREAARRRMARERRKEQACA